MPVRASMSTPVRGTVPHPADRSGAGDAVVFVDPSCSAVSNRV